MDPTSFPPQQALTYPTFPDSLFDDQGHAYAPAGGQGGFAVFDPGTGGMRQNYHLQWEPVAASANRVTATFTTDLSSIYRQVTIQPDWEDYEEGDIWEVDIPLEIGHAPARVRQLEWLKTVDDGRIRLRLTMVDDSPAELNLYCLHLDTEDPWRRTCANFAGELDYLVVVPAEEAVILHLRAGVELLTPFQFVLPVGQPEAAAYDVPALDSWLPYENPVLGLALRYPPDWTITERGNGLTLTAPQTAVIDSEEIPWTIWISAHPKFAADASLFDVIVNEYHFPDVIERFEETLTEEMVNGRMAYRSTIIPAIGGQQSVFFDDGDRFVGVTLRPFDAERPYENQAQYVELFANFLETIMFIES
jgi:hypothetical protein